MFKSTEKFHFVEYNIFNWKNNFFRNYRYQTKRNKEKTPRRPGQVQGLANLVLRPWCKKSLVGVWASAVQWQFSGCVYVFGRWLEWDRDTTFLVKSNMADHWERPTSQQVENIAEKQRSPRVTTQFGLSGVGLGKRRKEGKTWKSRLSLCRLTFDVCTIKKWSFEKTNWRRSKSSSNSRDVPVHVAIVVWQNVLDYQKPAAKSTGGRCWSSRLCLNVHLDANNGNLF